MKKITTLLSVLMVATGVFGQVTSSALGNSCKNLDEGTVEVRWNALLNCPAFDLTGINEFGFHSAAEDWGVFETGWDAATAVTAMRNSGDTVSVTVNAMDYWGIAVGDMTVLKFLFNNGAENPGDPWTLKGTDTVPGGFDCEDLFIDMTTLQECAMMDTSSTGINTIEAVAFLDAFPNPALENVTLSFPNATAEGFEVFITNALGQTVQTAFTSENRAVINRNGLPSGLYFATLQNEAGYRSTVRFQFH